MKRVVLFVFMLILIFCLIGCGTDNGTTTGETINPTAESTVTKTEPSTSQSGTDSVSETAAASETQVPYLQKIGRADFPVWSGPAYNNEHIVSMVMEAGVYTIVEEQWDSEGNLWGKLKSGLGWVDLTLLKSEENDVPLITISEVENVSLLGDLGDYYYCDKDVSQYSVTAVLNAGKELSNVSLFPLVMDYDKFVQGEEIYHIDNWSVGKPLVAELSFPGDLSSYGIRFTDSAGNEYKYSIYQSAREGAPLHIRAGEY